MRKKKCDERRPECALCESLSITCYGFGPKPDWMNDEEKEKAVLNELKEIVKHSWRRKRFAQFSKPIKVAPRPPDKSEETTSLGTLSSHQQGGTPSSYFGFLEYGKPDTSQESASLMPSSLPAISAEESVLLMRFLDSVFQIQYPIYSIEIVHEQGWLLSLILQNKAFYHAALALSAHHRSITLPAAHYEVRRAALLEQEKHFEACIKLISQSTDNSCPYSELGVMYAVVQLVFYEVRYQLK